jgi:trehalose synthase
MREVKVDAIDLERLTRLLAPERAQRFRDVASVARGTLSGRVLWNINSTAQGGGVAELLQTTLAYSRGAGVDTRWLVLTGSPEFFTVTKRLHNVLHGELGDGGPLADAEHDVVDQVLKTNLETLELLVGPRDLVLLHDPQTAGLVGPLRRMGLQVVWRCHIGRDEPNAQTDRGWAFLRPWIEEADAFVFSRWEYVPDWVPRERTWIIPPSIDPFTAKNVALAPAQVSAALKRTGLLGGVFEPDGMTFDRRDGTTGTVRRHRRLLVDRRPVGEGSRLVLQVSRWDRLKDMPGVMASFVDHLDDLPGDIELMLAGPDVEGVSDDPEGAAELDRCRTIWRSLPKRVRERVHLACLPMDDVDENAHLVNALQRHASVVVQKSIVEGFGLTVTEAMWKARPVVATAVGGIQDQIVDGEHGLLVQDPLDLAAFGEALTRVLKDDALAHHIGKGAQERVQDRFLGDRHLIQYAELFGTLVD